MTGVVVALAALVFLGHLQTLREIGGNESATIVFPFPLDLLQPLLEKAKDSGAGELKVPSPVPSLAANGGAQTDGSK